MSNEIHVSYAARKRPSGDEVARAETIIASASPCTKEQEQTHNIVVHTPSDRSSAPEAHSFAQEENHPDGYRETSTKDQIHSC